MNPELYFWRCSRNQYGMTLIELMIVVAIIGLLAAMAIPAYTDYTIRARVSEGLRLTSEAKDMVTEYYGTNSAWPTNNTAAGLADATDIKGHGVASVTVGGGGIILIEFNGKVDSGKRLQLVPAAGSGSVRWTCQIPATQGVSPRYVPSECRN
ncbi:pilin [Sphaerotilus sp.]|jgi:type IV pilus assembly protein PilA|uniref:pilin n=1 Tax=Sphaerotilus sp. TaxID=2093942 RepID=UPI0025CE9874|nr:pilin [Sphaerotilus sp.]